MMPPRSECDSYYQSARPHTSRAGIPSEGSFAGLGESHIPTLLLVGDADNAHAGAIEAGVPRPRRVAISDAGHLMYLKKPAEFSRIVIEFLENQTSNAKFRQAPDEFCLQIASIQIASIH